MCTLLKNAAISKIITWPAVAHLHKADTPNCPVYMEQTRGDFYVYVTEEIFVTKVNEKSGILLPTERQQTPNHSKGSNKIKQ